MPSIGHEFVIAQDVVLEVTVLAIGACLATRLHGTQGSHATVGLELLSVHEDHIPGCFLTAGEQRAEHHGACASHDRLSDVAGVLNATIANHRHTGGRTGSVRLIDCGDLRDSHTRHHAGGADRPGAHAYLYAVRTGIDELFRDLRMAI